MGFFDGFLCSCKSELQWKKEAQNGRKLIPNRLVGLSPENFLDFDFMGVSEFLNKNL